MPEKTNRTPQSAVEKACRVLDGQQLKWLAVSPDGRKAITRAALEAAYEDIRGEVLGEVREALEKRFEQRVSTERIWKSKATPGLGAARANARVRAFEEAGEEVVDVLLDDLAKLTEEGEAP